MTVTLCILVLALVILVVAHVSYQAGRTRGYIEGLNDGSLAAYRSRK